MDNTLLDTAQMETAPHAKCIAGLTGARVCVCVCVCVCVRERERERERERADSRKGEIQDTQGARGRDPWHPVSLRPSY